MYIHVDSLGNESALTAELNQSLQDELNHLIKKGACINYFNGKPNIYIDIVDTYDVKINHLIIKV